MSAAIEAEVATTFRSSLLGTPSAGISLLSAAGRSTAPVPHQAVSEHEGEDRNDQPLHGIDGGCSHGARQRGPQQCTLHSWLAGLLTRSVVERPHQGEDSLPVVASPARGAPARARFVDRELVDRGGPVPQHRRARPAGQRPVGRGCASVPDPPTPVRSLGTHSRGAVWHGSHDVGVDCGDCAGAHRFARALRPAGARRTRGSTSSLVARGDGQVGRRVRLIRRRRP